MVLSDSLLAAATILGTTALLQPFSRWTKIPFTVALLVLGFLFQLGSKQFGWDIHLSLSTDLIYFLLLPLMLFESAFHINFHQFKLQFKTISFLATFGVLTAILLTATGLTWLLGMPIIDALLFGAIIASTDPISVVSLFKELGVPKRLTLLAEGESMFNDASGVIFFRIIAGFAVTQQKFQTASIFHGLWDFLYLFVGSLLLGAVVGYAAAQFIARIKNDRLVEITLTVALALISFIGAEHFLHLSGVITTVAVGIVMGNIGRTKISPSVMNFMEEFWEYLAFLGVALVFFFAAFELNFSVFQVDLKTLFTVVIITLFARAISVYLGFFVTNNSPGFKNEPNVPLSWQHVMNWGGLRGVIPLVLVYSLPDDYYLKSTFIAFTLACFIFTLFINATSIRQIIMALKLHVPAKAEEIAKAEDELFALNEAKKKLSRLSPHEFSQSVRIEIERELNQKEKHNHQVLLNLSTPRELEQSLRLEIISIDRATIDRLFALGHISERTVQEFSSELDLQQDALEHPTLAGSGSIGSAGRIASQEQFQIDLKKIIQAQRLFGWIQDWLEEAKLRTIRDRMSLLRARIVAGMEALEYLTSVEEYFEDHSVAKKIIREIYGEQEQFLLKNTLQMDSLERDYPRMYQRFERELVSSLVFDRPDAKHH